MLARLVPPMLTTGGSNCRAHIRARLQATTSSACCFLLLGLCREHAAGGFKADVIGGCRQPGACYFIAVLLVDTPITMGEEPATRTIWADHHASSYLPDPTRGCRRRAAGVRTDPVESLN